MKEPIFLLFFILFAFQPGAQTNCVFKQPIINIHFGTGDAGDINAVLADYEPVYSSCPTDGHYTYTDYTSNCFRGDWHTLTEDHTPGDVSGNLLLVNSSYNTGTFFKTPLRGLKSGTTYEFAVWLMNVCKITDKCPYPLLPDITIRLQGGTGKTIAQF